MDLLMYHSFFTRSNGAYSNKKLNSWTGDLLLGHLKCLKVLRLSSKFISHSRKIRVYKFITLTFQYNHWLYIVKYIVSSQVLMQILIYKFINKKHDDVFWNAIIAWKMFFCGHKFKGFYATLLLPTLMHIPYE